MKKAILSLVLTVAMLLGCALPVAAEGEIEIIWRRTPTPPPQPEAPAAPSPVITAPDNVSVTAVTLTGEVLFSDNAESLGYKAEGSDCYALIDADGSPLTDAIYATMERDYTTNNLIVSLAGADPANRRGMIDPAGNVIVPTQYANIVSVSDRWIIGEHAQANGMGNTIDFYVYDDAGKVRQPYTISGVDVYYRGSLIGSLGSNDYTPGEVRSFGDYLCVKDRQGRYNYYDKSLTRSSYDSSEDSYFREFDYEYVDGTPIYTHTGSNQTAYAPGCTLTPDEVEDALMYSSEKHAVINLQGEVVYALDGDGYCSISDRHGDLFLFRTNDLYGLIDLEGNIVIQPLYDSIGNYSRIPLFQYGYAQVTLNDRMGFIDRSGKITCPIVYPDDYNYRYNDTNSFIVIKNLDGTMTVVSAAVGALTETFAKVGYRDDSSVFDAERLDGSYAVFDLYGNMLVQVSGASSIQVNNDGTVALVTMKQDDQPRNTPSVYTLLHINR